MTDVAQGFSLTLLQLGTPLPPAEIISAVFLMALSCGRVLATRNERGWDIPRGHREEGEQLLEALRREVREEAGAEIGDAVPFAMLSVPGRTRSMLFFATSAFEMGEWECAADAFDRAILPKEEFVARYHGDKLLMRYLLVCAEQRLAKT